jgi:hypothetical protein
MKGKRMKNFAKRVTIVLLGLVLVATLGVGFGCGGGGGGGEVTIKIGLMTDLTGAASPSLRPIVDAFVDTARYYNDEKLIPGVKIKLSTWDTHFDTARVIPGYDWLKSQGVKVISLVLATDAAIVRPFAERDKISAICSGATPDIENPPGWLFSTAGFSERGWNTMLKWVWDNEWDHGKGPAKIGYGGWNTQIDHEHVEGIKNYAAAHPDQFTYVPCALSPAGTADFTSVAATLKDCDYLSGSAPHEAYLVRDYLATGQTKAKLLDANGSLCANLAFMVKMNGWQCMDGAISMMLCLGLDERDISPLTQRMYDMLLKYRTGGGDLSKYADYLIYEAAGASTTAVVFDILDRCIKEVGAENVSSQAYYNEAIKYQADDELWKNYPVMGFSQTSRVMGQFYAIWKVNAAEQSYRWIGEWVPSREEP